MRSTRRLAAALAVAAVAGALNAIGRITTARAVTIEFNTPTQPSSPLVIALGSDRFTG